MSGVKYQIRVDHATGFICIFGMPERGDNFSYPVAFQVRGSVWLLERIAKAIAERNERMAEIEAHYHDDDKARDAFDQGFVTFMPGDIPVTLVSIQRYSTLIVGTSAFGDGPVRNLCALEKAIRQTLRREARKQAQS